MASRRGRSAARPGRRTGDGSPSCTGGPASGWAVGPDPGRAAVRGATRGRRRPPPCCPMPLPSRGRPGRPTAGDWPTSRRTPARARSSGSPTSRTQTRQRVEVDGELETRRLRWFPDGRALLYVADGRLRRADLEGRAPREIRFVARVELPRERTALPPVRVAEPGSERPARGLRGLALVSRRPVDRPHGTAAALGVPARCRAPCGRRGAARRHGPQLVPRRRGSGLVRGSGERRGPVRDRGPLRPDAPPDPATRAGVPPVLVAGRAEHRLHLRREERAQLRSAAPAHDPRPCGDGTDGGRDPRSGRGLALVASAGDVLRTRDAAVESGFARGPPVRQTGGTRTRTRAGSSPFPARPAIWTGSPRRPRRSSGPATGPSSTWTTTSSSRSAFEPDRGATGEPVLLWDGPAIYPSVSRDGSVLFVADDGLRIRRPDGRMQRLGWPLRYRVARRAATDAHPGRAHRVRGLGRAPSGATS